MQLAHARRQHIEAGAEHAAIERQGHATPAVMSRSATSRRNSASVKRPRQGMAPRDAREPASRRLTSITDGVAGMYGPLPLLAIKRQSMCLGLPRASVPPSVIIMPPTSDPRNLKARF